MTKTEIEQLRDIMLSESSTGRLKLSMADYNELFGDKQPKDALDIYAEDAKTAFRRANDILQRDPAFCPQCMMIQLTFKNADTCMEDTNYLNDFVEWCHLDAKEQCSVGLTVGTDIPNNCHLAIIYR